MYKKNALFFILTFICTYSFVYTQTANVFIDVGGSRSTGGPAGSGGICSPQTASLAGAADADGQGDNVTSTGLEHGPYNFDDPVPPNNKITNVEVVLHNSICMEMVDIDVASAMIMGYTTMNSCQSNTLSCPNSDNRTNVDVDFGCSPSLAYNYGGMNQFDVTLINAGQFDVVTFTHAELIFTYESCSEPTQPIPTMSQWGLLIFGLLIMNLSVFYIQCRELIQN